MTDNKAMISHQDLSIDSQSRIYNKQLFMQTLSQLSTYQDLPQTNNFKKAAKNPKSNFVDIFKGQDISSIEALDISNLELANLEEQPDLEELIALEMLNASNNLFINVSDFLRFNSLVYLDLSHNKLTSLYCIDMLTNLKTLIVAENNLEDIEPLIECKKLKVLDLSNNKLSHLFECLNTLKHLRKLKNLNLQGNPLCISYLYKHETLLQLRGLGYLDGEKITDADFEVSEKLKQKYFDVEEETETQNIGNKGMFSKKLRNLAEYKKDEEEEKNDQETFAVEIQNKNETIENLKKELNAKDDRIKYLENELTIEKSIVKAYELFKLENKELKAKLETLTQSLDQSECNSLACKERYLLMSTRANMYMDEITNLKKKIENPNFNHSKSMVLEPNSEDKKLKQFEIRKKKRNIASANVLLNSESNEIPISNDINTVNDHDNDDITDNDLEEFLKSSLHKLDEAKNLLREIPTSKTKDIHKPSKAPMIFAKKLGQKKNFNFLKDKKLTPLQKPL